MPRSTRVYRCSRCPSSRKPRFHAPCRPMTLLQGCLSTLTKRISLEFNPTAVSAEKTFIGVCRVLRTRMAASLIEGKLS